jgi:DNA-binding transcriptional LysR family regulator
MLIAAAVAGLGVALVPEKTVEAELADATLISGFATPFERQWGLLPSLSREQHAKLGVRSISKLADKRDA